MIPLGIVFLVGCFRAVHMQGGTAFQQQYQAMRLPGERRLCRAAIRGVTDEIRRCSNSGRYISTRWSANRINSLRWRNRRRRRWTRGFTCYCKRLLQLTRIFRWLWLVFPFLKALPFCCLYKIKRKDRLSAHQSTLKQKWKSRIFPCGSHNANAI